MIHQVEPLFRFQQEEITAVGLMLMVVFSVGGMIRLVKSVIHQVAHLFKFQQDTITVVE